MNPFADELRLDREGAERVHGAGLPALDAIEALLPRSAPGTPGTRLHGIAVLATIAGRDGAIGSLAAERLGAGARPVRAILFDKSPAANWGLGWHQDRVIAVRRRVEVPGFGPWTVKQGLLHVAPPFATLAGMLTLRVHLDAVPEANAPLLVAPGSHRARVAEADVDGVVRACGVAVCLADAGDVWVYATPILHASRPAEAPDRRRVLQIDYAAAELPGGLSWLGL